MHLATALTFMMSYLPFIASLSLSLSLSQSVSRSLFYLSSSISSQTYDLAASRLKFCERLHPVPVPTVRIACSVVVPLRRLCNNWALLRSALWRVGFVQQTNIRFYAITARILRMPFAFSLTLLPSLLYSTVDDNGMVVKKEK